ncbi:MAG: hypothetical protein U1F35_09030 [Steroidobacteraceae bacterium]
MPTRYSFIICDSFELAGTLGVNLLDFSARARVQRPTGASTSARTRPAPFLPEPGRGLVDQPPLLPGRSCSTRALRIDQLDGSLGLYELSALYRWRANVALGLGYHKERAKLSSTKTTESGFFDLDTKGRAVRPHRLLA